MSYFNPRGLGGRPEQSQELALQIQLDELDDAHPGWRTIVGAVYGDEEPNSNHPYRKWLSTKPRAYRKRLEATFSAAVIGRSIDMYQKETGK